MSEVRVQGSALRQAQDEGAAGETQASVGAWAMGLAPHAGEHPAALACRLLQEAVELCIAAGAKDSEIDDAVDEEIVKASKRRELGCRKSNAEIAKEAADVQILAWVFAQGLGFDLAQAADAKMVVNRSRHWHVTEQGTLYSRSKARPAS